MDIKLFAKNDKESEILIQVVRIYSQNIGMEFGKEKYAMLITTHDGMNRATKPRKDQNVRRKRTYKYLEVLEADTIKLVKM